MDACTARSSNRSQLQRESASVIGRERELAELESLLFATDLDPAPVVVVHGRRGIGKTTLAAALAQRAASHRFAVVWAAESQLSAVPARSLVILDNACEVDASKLEQLEELTWTAKSVRVLILCRGARFRLRPHLASWLARTQTEPGCRFLMLRPLQGEAADALVRVACGGPVSAEAVLEVSRRTGGDPSLIQEFARVLRRHPAGDLRVEVPETVAGLVGLRLATLDAKQRCVAEMASLFNGAFAVQWLAPVADLTEPEALAGLRSAEDAGLVSQHGDDRFEMSAPVVRDAVRSLVFGGNLQQAHRRLAEALISLPEEARAGAHAEIARQYHASRQLPGADRGVEPALQAAGHALAARTPFRATELLELGLELCAHDQPAMRARLTGALAKAWASALCHAEAVCALEQACQRMHAADAAGAQIAEFVIEVSSALPLAVGSVDAAAPARIRALVGEVEEAVSVRVEAALDSRRPRLSGPTQLHDRMVRIARAADSRRRTAAIFRAATETVEVLIEPALIAPLLRQAYDEAGRLGSSAARSLAYSLRAVAAGRAGDLAAACELAQAAVDANARRDSQLREPPMPELVQLLTRTHTDPDWEHLSASAARLAAEYRASGYAVSFTAIVASARARVGDGEGSRAALLEVIAALEPVHRYASWASAALGPAVEAAWRLNDRHLGERLLPLVASVLDAGGGDFYMSQRDLTMARLALLGGQWDEASLAFDRASVALDGASERTLLTVVKAERHQALTAREGASALGSAGLTRRQLQVLLLVSEGLTNQQIAEHLVVSINTVNRHVADIYRKIGASNRVGAAVYVARHGLASS